MAWPGIEPSSPHLTYLILAAFLILYALFSQFIRNRLHLSEPPLATLLGIIFGPRGLTGLDPNKWGWADNVTQEATRVIVGVQCFVVGVELPKRFFARRWKSMSVAVMLGPVMTSGWLVSALATYLLFDTTVSTALIVGACLTPTDPVLSASIIGESRFSSRVPKRLRHLLSAESGCNDGVSFAFLYVGIFAVIRSTAGGAVKDWFLDTILWQCLIGSIFGLIIGKYANFLLRVAERKDCVMESSFFVFYFLLAIFSVGVGSTLGLDDFLVAFFAGTAFAWDGWFARKIAKTHLPDILDLLLNSSMFVYFGAIIPWNQFVPRAGLPNLTPGRLVGHLALILLFRRIPIVLAMKRWTPDIKTYREALFCGHFGPMGLGALFLAIEARARLETGTSIPLPHPPKDTPHERAIETVWPVICFVVLGSIMVHGLSAAVMSVASHFSRKEDERKPLIGAETDRLYGMVHEGESELSFSGAEESDAETWNVAAEDCTI